MEGITGYDFFSNLPNEIEEVIEDDDSSNLILPLYSAALFAIPETFQIDALKINLHQVNSTQINSTEISLPSSIALQQFLSSHNFSLQNTSVPTWVEFLQGSSPFNLNIEIADLPTGQLAEATITSFDPTGQPNSGTLYLDTDANGLGWFIDPTPWDNTEFSTTLSATAYRATADSLAYGHYDRLTTILHETSHLQGFIFGYSNYDRHIQTQNGSKTFVGDGFSAILTDCNCTPYQQRCYFSNGSSQHSHLRHSEYRDLLRENWP